MAEASKHNVIQDMKIDEHERRIVALEESTQALLLSTTALNTSVEVTNNLLSEGFSTMKKLAIGIVTAMTAIFGVGSQTGMM